MNGKCPGCNAEVPLSNSVKVGYVTYCPECDGELQVVSLNPVELDWSYDDSDYDDYDDDDDD